LQNGDRPLGVLSLARRTASPFSRDEIDIAQVFADYIGMALHAEKSRSNRYYPKEK
jgi:GAF domain-containing protein